MWNYHELINHGEYWQVWGLLFVQSLVVNIYLVGLWGNYTTEKLVPVLVGHPHSDITSAVLVK